MLSPHALQSRGWLSAIAASTQEVRGTTGVGMSMLTSDHSGRTTQRKELLAGASVISQGPVNGGCDRPAVVRSHPAPCHALVLCLEDHPHPLWL